MSLIPYISICTLIIYCEVPSVSAECTIPIALRNTWFSIENGQQTITNINASGMTGRGACVNIEADYYGNYTMVFQYTNCYYCVKFIVRTVNVLEKIETPCVDLGSEEEPTVERVCRDLNADQNLITLFSENTVPVNCRSSLEGVWQFGYHNRFKFNGECNHPEAQIKSCQTTGTQFFTNNQKFNITYRKCPGLSGTFDEVVEYNCLGDWFVNKHHFFAAANTKESRKEEKYRCFLKNLDDDNYIGASNAAQCNTLETVENSPERYTITPVKAEVVEPESLLPRSVLGEWINTANIDADVFINETHIIETYYSDGGRYRRTIYVCRERSDTRVMMVRLAVDGCQKDYVCFDFVSKHQNVIRYRKGPATIQNDFHKVCSKQQFLKKQRLYNTFLKKDPDPIRCPVAGKFSFIQKGDMKFEPLVFTGITLSPRPSLKCERNINVFSVCDEDRKNLEINVNYCMAVDVSGRPIDIYHSPDYKVNCIGYWKENLKSYLITFDELDPFSKYRCWVYQRADLNRVLMSQALGPYCDFKQDATSWNYTEGAAVALEMTNQGVQCLMDFDDGSDLWSTTEEDFTMTHSYWTKIYDLLSSRYTISNIISN